MCGITGVLKPGNGPPIGTQTVRQMLGAIRHRGPDQFGLYLHHSPQARVGLGSARLSIIDLGGGQQPIGNEDGTLWIVFNGEIFNYVELRPTLEKQGHVFATASDTEIIIHLYEEYGPDCVQHLNGQFAFAIWDETRQELFLARDRLGIRPLYLSHRADGVLWFSSEMKAIFAGGEVQPRFDATTLDQILTYWSPLSPRTIFEGVETLPPGTWLRVDANDRIHQQRYWQPDFTLPTPAPGPDEAARQLRELLVDATQIRLRADVPVGAYLSGGLDSSTIAALIHHYTPRQLETFSIAFTDASYDERPYQEQMATHLGTRHHIVTASHADIGNAFPDVIWHTETPLTRTSPVPLYLLSRLVHSHDFKVVLTGEGADEFLGGYNIFKEAQIRRFWARQPNSNMRPQLLARLYPYIGGLSQGSGAYLRQFFGKDLSATADPYYAHAIRWRNTTRSKRFLTPDFRASLPNTAVPPLPSNFADWSPLAQAQYLEISVFMAEYLLSSQGDRVAMAHAVEGRFPFLDHRVVTFCNQLPSGYKLRGLNEKSILKRAMSDLLPPAIGQRPKRPYRAPIQHSFFPGGRPLPWVAALTTPEAVGAAGVFNPNAVASLTRKIQRLGALGETDEMALTAILSTQLIFDQFIDHFQPPPALTATDDVKTVQRSAVATSPSQG